MRGAGAGGGMPPRGGERGQDRVEVVGEARRDGGRGAAAGGASGGGSGVRRRRGRGGLQGGFTRHAQATDAAPPQPTRRGARAGVPRAGRGLKFDDFFPFVLCFLGAYSWQPCPCRPETAPSHSPRPSLKSPPLPKAYRPYSPRPSPRRRERPWVGGAGTIGPVGRRAGLASLRLSREFSMPDDFDPAP